MEKRDLEFAEGLWNEFFSLVGSPGEGKRISQAKAAQLMHYSSGVISAYKSKSYTGDIQKLEERVKGFIEREKRRMDRIVVPTVHTGTLVSIKKAVDLTQIEQDICVAVGPSGSGKTTAVKQIEADNPSAIVIEADSSMTKNVLITEIARALSVETKGGMTTVIGRIIEALSVRDVVIIIDEADYLSNASLELVRRVINDKGHTGVVLVGLPRLRYMLENRRNDHEQLTSRVGVMLEVKALARTDAVKIIEGVWKGLPKETLDGFYKGAKGSARTLVKLMGRVHQTMALNHLDTPDEEVIEAAGEMLMR
jgi:DNA transposition AAA+ family ATPase